MISKLSDITSNDYDPFGVSISTLNKEWNLKIVWLKKYNVFFSGHSLATPLYPALSWDQHRDTPSSLLADSVQSAAATLKLVATKY